MIYLIQNLNVRINISGNGSLSTFTKTYPLGFTSQKPILAQAQEVLQLILPWANSDMTGPSHPNYQGPFLETY